MQRDPVRNSDSAATVSSGRGAGDAPSLAERLTDVYWQRIRTSGIGPSRSKARYGELLEKVAACTDHFRDKDAKLVAEITRILERYDRLREAAGIDSRLLEQPSYLLPGPLGPMQATIEAAVGAPLALFGFLTSALPYYMTKAITGRDGAETLSRKPLLAGAILFAATYGVMILLVALRYSDAATIGFALLLIPAGFFAGLWRQRMRKIAAHIGGRTASLFKLDAVRRVRDARDELVAKIDAARNRYRTEALGWPALPAGGRRRHKRYVVLGVGAAVAVLLLGGLFLYELRDRPVEGLPEGPSPWFALYREDPASAEREILRDARGVLVAAHQLDHLKEQLGILREAFGRGERTYLSELAHEEMNVMLTAYLDLRGMLLRTVWRYRGANADAAAGPEVVAAQAFLTAYVAAAMMVETANLVHETFLDDDVAIRKINGGDEAWGLPAGIYDRFTSSLTNRSLMAPMQAATEWFENESASGRLPAGDPWEALAARAHRARPAIGRVMDRLEGRKLRLAVRRMRKAIDGPVQTGRVIFSITLSDLRLKDRPAHQGLISREQTEALRQVLRPGDILVERRNWYLTNCMLPGYWPHAALYLGTSDDLAALGVWNDPRAAHREAEFSGNDELGHSFAVIEAVGEGVIFTSLEHSVGEADAVVVFRPQITEVQRREALARAIRHRGKKYDFDFDFETSDVLVCTELVYRAYDGLLVFPEFAIIMGHRRLPANGFVEMWSADRGKPVEDRRLMRVRFLDFDERNQRAVLVEDEETLVETLSRSRFTFLD